MTASRLIAAMTAVVAPARSRLDRAELATLRDLTGYLLQTRDGQSESIRFRDTMNRALVMPEYAPPVDGRTIIVTGGTGCIGSALLRRLAADPGNRIYSVSRGVTVPPERVSGVAYLHVDIRDADAVRRTFRIVRPDTVYHLAAVRDPALAEIEVARTIATNVVGTANLIAAARQVGVEAFVYASTGKAVRFYTSDVYAATKKIGERLVANSGLPVCSFVRYTHVVDNSLIMQKLVDWCDGGLVRLHDPDIAFYVQSALESAQLLQVAARRSGFYTIRDLDWPVLLLDLALDRMRESGRISPIYFCGYEPGYEAAGYPGLYDPDVSGETGPLINALEGYSATAVLGGQLNHVPIAVGDSDLFHAVVNELNLHCVQQSPASVLRDRLNAASYEGLVALLGRTEAFAIERLSELATRYRSATEEHRMIASTIGARNDANHAYRDAPRLRRPQCIGRSARSGPFSAPGRYQLRGHPRNG